MVPHLNQRPIATRVCCRVCVSMVVAQHTDSCFHSSGTCLATLLNSDCC